MVQDHSWCKITSARLGCELVQEGQHRRQDSKIQFWFHLLARDGARACACACVHKCIRVRAHALARASMHTRTHMPRKHAHTRTCGMHSTVCRMSVLKGPQKPRSRDHGSVPLRPLRLRGLLTPQGLRLQGLLTAGVGLLTLQCLLNPRIPARSITFSPVAKVRTL